MVRTWSVRWVTSSGGQGPGPRHQVGAWSQRRVARSPSGPWRAASRPGRRVPACPAPCGRLAGGLRAACGPRISGSAATPLEVRRTTATLPGSADSYRSTCSRHDVARSKSSGRRKRAGRGRSRRMDETRQVRGWSGPAATRYQIPTLRTRPSELSRRMTSPGASLSPLTQDVRVAPQDRRHERLSISSSAHGRWPIAGSRRCSRGKDVGAQLGHGVQPCMTPSRRHGAPPDAGGTPWDSTFGAVSC